MLSTEVLRSAVAWYPQGEGCPGRVQGSELAEVHVYDSGHIRHQTTSYRDWMGGGFVRGPRRQRTEHPERRSYEERGTELHHQGPDGGYPETLTW